MNNLFKAKTILFLISMFFCMLQACTEKEFIETITTETSLAVESANSLDLRYNERNKIADRLLPYDSSISKKDMIKLKESMVIDNSTLRGLNYAIVAKNYKGKQFCEVMEALFNRKLKFVNFETFENTELNEAIKLHNLRHTNDGVKGVHECVSDLTPVEKNGVWSCPPKEHACCVTALL